MRGKANTPSKISLKRKKRVISWEANKQTKSATKNKESKADFTGNGKGRDKIHFFLCEVEEEGYKEAKESTKRKIWREMVISIP